MSPDGTAQPAPDLLSQIWTISTTLTEEAMTAAQKKCEELGFDPNRGIVPLQETFINLSSARGVLEDAIEKRKLIQLPITVQKEILTDLSAVSKSIQGLTAGTDEVVNLATAVETLNTSIWKYGLHNLSDEVLGYQKKLNQLKNLEVQLTKAIHELGPAQKAAERATLAADEIGLKKAEASSALEQVKQFGSASETLLGQIKESGAQCTAVFSTIQQQEKVVGELTSNVKTANNELLSLDASIKKFYSEVDEYRDKINKTSEDAAGLIRTSNTALEKLIAETTDKAATAADALQKNATSVSAELTAKADSHKSEINEKFTKLVEGAQSNLAAFQKEAQSKIESKLNEDSKTIADLLTNAQTKLSAAEKQLNERSSETIEANHAKTIALTDELHNLEAQIREQIQQATGFTLFGAFQARQNQIASSKKLWAYAILALVIISAAVTAWIAFEAQSYKVTDVALWVKLSLTIPLGYAIGFCTVQYNRERRLEEEYAFKSSISVSLNPYRDLIRSMLEKDGNIEQAKFTQFVIESVTNVFTPPTDKVFEAEKHHGLPAKTLKQVAEVFGTAIKAAK